MGNSHIHSNQRQPQGNFIRPTGHKVITHHSGMKQSQQYNLSNTPVYTQNRINTNNNQLVFHQVQDSRIITNINQNRQALFAQQEHVDPN